MSISSESFLEPDPVLAALNEAAGEILQEGPPPELNDAVRGKGCFERVMKRYHN